MTGYLCPECSTMMNSKGGVFICWMCGFEAEDYSRGERHIITPAEVEQARAASEPPMCATE